MKPEEIEFLADRFAEAEDRSIARSVDAAFAMAGMRGRGFLAGAQLLSKLAAEPMVSGELSAQMRGAASRFMSQYRSLRVMQGNKR